MSKKDLHPVQKKLLDLLAKNIDDPLTFREMQSILDISSTSVIAHHLTRLEKKGYLKRNPFNPRDYQVLADAPERQITYLNLYGLVRCGQEGSVLDGNPIDRIPISTRLLTFPSADAFLVKAKGDSMTPKINEGDLLIVRKKNDAESGAIVVCVNAGEAIVKKMLKEKEGCILVSLNPAHPPFSASKGFRIEGEVKGIISSLW